MKIIKSASYMKIAWNKYDPNLSRGNVADQQIADFNSGGTGGHGVKEEAFIKTIRDTYPVGTVLSVGQVNQLKKMFESVNLSLSLLPLRSSRVIGPSGNPVMEYEVI